MAGTIFRPFTMALSLMTLIILCGCLGRSQPARFYLLAPISNIPSGETAAGVKGDLRIGVGPIYLPAYVERSQIVSRISTHELGIAEFHRWSEPLKESVPRILEENIAVLLSTPFVYKYPWPGSTPLDYQVEVYVTRFDGELGGDAVLAARWALFAGEHKRVLFVKHSSVTRPTSGTGYEDLVAAENAALGQLSREIADAIKSIVRGQ